VPPILKLWPFSAEKLFLDQILLQWVINQSHHMGMKGWLIVSKAKRGVCAGILAFMSRWN